MASTLKVGSRGDEVLNLQNMLNQQGYNLTADGIYGDKTAAAVKQYQQSMGLTVDGIVGTNTWSALTSGGSASGTGGGTSGSASGTTTTYNPAYDFDTLLASLQKNTYTPLTEEEIRQQAQNRYDPIFNQNKLSAEQANEKGALALQQQLESLQPTYDKQRETTAEAFAKAFSNANKQTLSRGMQRSSYNNQTLANIDIAGAKAQDEIGAAQVRDENAINQQASLNAQQLAQFIQQLENDYTTNVAAYQDAIRNQDYDRATAAAQYANELERYLYEASRQQSQWAAEFAENQRQFNASLAASTSRSGGSGGSKQTTPAAKPAVNVPSAAQSPVFVPITQPTGYTYPFTTTQTTNKTVSNSGTAAKLKDIMLNPQKYKPQSATPTKNGTTYL